MKRGPLRRRRPLSPPPARPNGPRRSGAGLASRGRERAAERLLARRAEPGYAVWHAPHRGPCQVCGRPGPLVRHHVLLEQTVRRAGGDPWDLRNALELGRHCRCHEGQHARGVTDRRIDFRSIPEDAVDFAQQLLGEGAAAIYFHRRYRNAPAPA